jgi:plastocyanin
VALAAAVLVGCGSSSSSSSGAPTATTASTGGQTTTVVLKNIAFTPAAMHIHVGDTVTWEWKDSPVPHNVTFATFSSPTQDSGTFSHRFDSAGTFTYSCTIHTQMTGTVTVG